MLGPRIPAAGCKRPRKGKRCVGSPASGRENTTYTRDRRADHTGRTQKGQAGAGEERPKSGKRTYRTKKDRPRLCADDVMARDKLKAYQTTYAEAMAKYGLQRGVEGSEANIFPRSSITARCSSGK